MRKGLGGARLASRKEYLGCLFVELVKCYRNVMLEERRELIARVDRNGASTLAVAVMGGNIRAASNRIAGRGAWTLRPSPKPRPALLPELSFT